MTGRGHSAVVVTGRAALLEVSHEVERLLDDAGVPVTAQWWWLRDWLDCHLDWNPWTVLLRDLQGGLAGVALLAERGRVVVDEIVALGYGQSDYHRLVSREPSCSEALGEAVAGALQERRRPWRLYLNELPDGDVAGAALARSLRSAEIEAGAGAAVIDVTGGLTSADLRPNARKRVRRARNHLARDGRTVRVERTRDADTIVAHLPFVEAVHRRRDRAVRGYSDLDDPAYLAFWHRIIASAAARGVAELSVLSVDDRLGAYLVAFLDGSSYRVWDCRLDPEFGDYGLGHIIRDEVLDALAAEGGWTEFDWMRGVEEYKLRTATAVIPSLTVRAWSTPVLRAAEQFLRAARSRLRARGRRADQPSTEGLDS